MHTRFLMPHGADARLRLCLICPFPLRSAQLTDCAADLVTAVKSPAEALAALSLKQPAAGASDASGSGSGGDEAEAAGGGGSDAEEDDDEDPMVTQLRAYAASHMGAQTAERVRGLACEGAEHRCHVALAALLDCSSSSAPPLGKQLSAARCAALAGAAPDAAARGALLAALEAYVTDAAEEAPQLLKSLSVALKNLYDADVVDEPSLVAWYDNAAAARKFGVSPDGAKAARKAAFAFVDWLRCVVALLRCCIRFLRCAFGCCALRARLTCVCLCVRCSNAESDDDDDEE
jgi:hypothetical protein